MVALVQRASFQKLPLGHALGPAGELRGGRDIAPCKVLVSLTPAPSLDQDVATWTLQHRMLGFPLRETYSHGSIAPEQRSTSHPSRGLRSPPDSPRLPVLYLVRECLPMRTRRSSLVKFLSQGGYRIQWAAVRTQRSLMRLAPHNSSWGFFRKSITCLGGRTGSIRAGELPLHQP